MLLCFLVVTVWYSIISAVVQLWHSLHLHHFIGWLIGLDYLAHATPFHRLSWKSGQKFLCIPADKLTNKQIWSEPKTSLAKVTIFLSLRILDIHYCWQNVRLFFTPVQRMTTTWRGMSPSRSWAGRFRIKLTQNGPTENWCSWNVSTTRT